MDTFQPLNTDFADPVIALFNPQNVPLGPLAMDCIRHHTRLPGDGQDAPADMVIVLAPTEAELASLPPRHADTDTGLWLAMLPPDSPNELKAALAEWSDCLILARPEQYSPLLRDLVEPIIRRSFIGVDLADFRTLFNSGKGVARYYTSAGMDLLNTRSLPAFLGQSFNACFSSQQISVLTVLTMHFSTGIKDFEAVSNYFRSQEPEGWLVCCTRDAHEHEPMRVGCFVVEDASLSDARPEPGSNDEPRAQDSKYLDIPAFLGRKDQ